MSEADQMRAALRYAEKLFLSAAADERPVIQERMVLLQEWLDANDKQNGGGALGMPGVPFEKFGSRQDIEPLRVAMPLSLPGGKWGSGPQAFAVQTDALGKFVLGSGPRSLLAEAGAELLRAEWSIPTLWNVQVQLEATGLPLGWPAGWSVNVSVTGAVDNSECAQVMNLANGPGCYPFQGANALALLGSTYQLVAQQVRIRLLGFSAPPGPPISLDALITVQAVAGLASASMPPERAR